MTDVEYALLDAPPAKPERRPGDFDRDANGTPWVSHPQGERTKPKRKGDEGTIKRVRYSRPSGYGEQILDSYNLTKWGERMIMAGVSHGLGTVNEQRLNKLAPPNNDDAEWRKEADSLVKLAKERAKHMLAADRGTQAHGLTEAADLERDYIAMIDDGVNLGLSEDVQHALVDCWKKMLDRHGIEILATELAVVHDGYRCAGTLDRIVRLRRDLTFCLPGGELVTLKAGTVLVLDLKTGKLRHDNGEVSFWDNYPIQVAIYAGSVGYNPDTDERYDLPWTVDQRWAIIAHLDVLGAIDGDPSCELILVDLELGRAGADLAQAARAYEKADTKFSLVGTCQVKEPLPDPHKHANDFATPTVTAPVAPAEGDPVTDVDDIRTRYLALSAVGRAWVDGKRSEALSAGVDFHLAGHYTQRRLAIMDALCVLAVAEMDDDDACRALVRFATTDDAMEWPTVPAGAAVGSMNAVQADTFVNAARLLTGGLVGLEVGDDGAKLTGVGA